MYRFRRSISALLLTIIVAFHGAAIARAITADSETDLPPCCRRHGKHHCAMLDLYRRLQVSGAPVWTAPIEHCPLYPQEKAQATTPIAMYLPAHGAAIFAGIVSHPAVREQTLARYRMARDRARLKRGPPLLFV